MSIYVAPGAFGSTSVSLPHRKVSGDVGPSLGGGLALSVPLGRTRTWGIGGALESHASWMHGTRQFLSQRLLATADGNIWLGGHSFEFRFRVQLLLGAQWFDAGSLLPPGHPRAGFAGGMRFGFEAGRPSSRARFFVLTGTDVQLSRPEIPAFNDGVDTRDTRALVGVARGIVVAGIELTVGSTRPAR